MDAKYDDDRSDDNDEVLDMTVEEERDDESEVEEEDKKDENDSDNEKVEENDSENEAEGHEDKKLARDEPNSARKATKRKRKAAGPAKKKAKKTNVVRARKRTLPVNEIVAEENEDGKKKENGEEASDTEEQDDNNGRKKKTTQKIGKKKNSNTAKAKVDISDIAPMIEDPHLPSGWRRKVVQRQSGKTEGKFDVYIFSPDQKKFRSRSQLQKHLKEINSDLDADLFDFTVRGEGNTKKIKKTPAAKSESLEVRASSRKKMAAKKTPQSKQRLLVKLKFQVPKKDEEEKALSEPDDDKDNDNDDDDDDDNEDAAEAAGPSGLSKTRKSKVGETANGKGETRSKRKYAPKRKNKKGKAAKSFLK